MKFNPGMEYDWFILAYMLALRLYNHIQYKNKRCEAIYTKKTSEIFALD